MHWLTISTSVEPLVMIERAKSPEAWTAPAAGSMIASGISCSESMFVRMMELTAGD